MLAPRHQHVQQPRQQRREPHILEPAGQRVAQEHGSILVLDHAQQGRHGARDLLGHGARIVGLVQPVGGGTGEIDAFEFAMDDRIAHEIVFEEIAQVLANTFLVAGNNGGVGNFEAQRMAKQRRHGEPVGNCAHHGRFGKGTDETDRRMPVAQQAANHEHDRHQGQQPRGDGAHAGQPHALLGFLRRWGDGGQWLSC